MTEQKQESRNPLNGHLVSEKKVAQYSSMERMEQLDSYVGREAVVKLDPYLTPYWKKSFPNGV